MEDESPRDLPRIALLSELRGQVRSARDLAQSKSRAERKGDATDRFQRDGTKVPRTKPSSPPVPGGNSAQPRGRKVPKKPTAERFWAITLYNLGQRETSSAGLRRLLSNRVLRYTMRMEGEVRAAAEAEGMALVETTVARAVAERLIDDARFAEMKARSWRDRGWGERRITMEMRRKGIAPETAQDALGSVDADAIEGVEDEGLRTQEADLVAAETLCRRRRIGPFRRVQPETPQERAQIWRREAGVLARAGFSGSVVSEMLGRPASDEAQWE